MKLNTDDYDFYIEREIPSFSEEILSNLNITIDSVSISVPPHKYNQKEIIEHFSITNPQIKKFFEYDHIQYRHLYLPPRNPMTLTPIEEGQGQLLEKFQKGALEIGSDAIEKCLNKERLKSHEIDFLCCVTSTGFIVPGLSAVFIRELGFRHDCQRLDIVGMGCHAGINGLNAVTSWSAINPGKRAVLLCVEICSAIYTVEDTPESGIVNSLFGDGAAACLIQNRVGATKKNLKKTIRPKILAFESQLIPASWQELRFNWNDKKNRYSFFVGKDTPRATAAVADRPLSKMLNRFALIQRDIKHWIVHGGGNAILVGMQKKLNLDDDELRHTRSVLRDYGNISSGSFLFSYNRLLEENIAKQGDYGLMMTMGPGLTIEMALILWEEF